MSAGRRRRASPAGRWVFGQRAVPFPGFFTGLDLLSVAAIGAVGVHVAFEVMAQPLILAVRALKNHEAA